MMKKIIKKIVPIFLLGWYHYGLALLGAIIYGFPSKKLKIIGVTGTKGKTTVIELIVRILEEADYKVASLSSLNFKIGEKEWRNALKMTMPGRLKLQKFLRQAVKAGCHYAVIEVTSEGILQQRHKFIDFDAAVFTNLAPEHIEAHGSFENYKQAKGKLFKALRAKTGHQRIAVVNLDDAQAEYFLSFPADQRYGYKLTKAGTPGKNLNYIIEGKNLVYLPSGFSFQADHTDFNLNLLGQFNVYNALAAICVGLSQGVSPVTIKKALEKIKGVPGRMEFLQKAPFWIIVDYAHTPDSLEGVYQTLERQFPEARNKICVLGAAGGGRDKWKRPVLGQIAAKFCDRIILTDEDPYDENPVRILAQIKSGIPDTRLKITERVSEIMDRREAIRQALISAGVRDMVVITGKGSEPWMCVANGKKIPWDDRQVVREELEKFKFSKNNFLNSEWS